MGRETAFSADSRFVARQLGLTQPDKRIAQQLFTGPKVPPRDLEADRVYRSPPTSTLKRKCEHQAIRLTALVYSDLINEKSPTK
ncbi:hypothetical protein ASC90_15210 [Rhizobium sp. Root1220]|nr:hypothetical protein ASC90_15210 [Rhizobium sp. Root1220]